MSGRSWLRLVLLISCAHALVHVFELALPSVEQEIAGEFFPDDPATGRATTGWMSWCWRLPWGLGALFAGWLVDLWGSRRMLAVYLLGCAAACGAAAAAANLPVLFAAMFSMGLLASIYHPAGLALISHTTDPEDLPRALSIHGIFGSAGIASAPAIAAILLAGGLPWRAYYVCLAIPGGLLGLTFLLQAGRDRPAAAAGREGEHDGPEKDDNGAKTEKAGEETEGSAGKQAPARLRDAAQDWPSFFLLTGLALLQGIVYSAVMSFLPRYLSGWRPSWSESLGVGTPKLLAGMVLIIGCAGQYLAGRLAVPSRLERLLTWITLGNAPCLIWMAWATGSNRVLAAAFFALVHFMHQPIYNSLIAKYTPPGRRSLCYGFSFAMGLGVGSAGAVFAGYSDSETQTYVGLAIVAVLAAVIGWALVLRNRPALADDEDGDR